MSYTTTVAVFRAQVRYVWSGPVDMVLLLLHCAYLRIQSLIDNGFEFLVKMSEWVLDVRLQGSRQDFSSRGGSRRLAENIVRLAPNRDNTIVGGVKCK